MHRRLIAVVAAALAAGAALAPALPAAAATRTSADRAGDAPVFLDIAGLKVYDSKQEVAIKALVPGFDQTRAAATDGTGDDFSSLTLEIAIRGAKRSHVDATLGRPSPKAPIDTLFLYRTASNPFSEFTCAGATDEVADGYLKVVLPHSCFGAERGSSAGDVRGEGDHAGQRGSAGVPRRHVHDPVGAPGLTVAGSGA